MFKSEQIQLGISACLMGEKVRFDSGHKRSHFCVEELGKHVKYQAFCPEVAVGMPVPRPTIRQIRKQDMIHVARPDGSGDVTEAMQAYGKKVAAKMQHLSGYVFCAKSPSCGMERVKVYHENGSGSESVGVGVFAAEVMRANPLMPCEESGRLNDAIIRENFVMRVFTYHKWQCLVETGLTKGKIIQFHSQHKYLLMAHSLKAYKELGQLLAQADFDVQTTASLYIAGLMAGLKNKATRRSHTNTLQHLQGYFKKELNKWQKAELSEQIRDYRNGLVPLLAPLTLLKHYLLAHPKAYLQSQVYLDPYPADLKLRYAY
ncbi:hypothetical protein C2869_02670 [Saccharobesus litoralis]|uniref:DUF1722 domain-containing protein n=1 Tax=Saccharobesus litoralis TaxID=2172099 RepID=A0A2S0VMH9_9ALTE|nr:DUF523 and DUF1722 domain-containing protein [Saccharobesus litoralis]AWB65405.1 hypothetical protein C2869_02670 [Saccharobesus litoralis]